MKISEIHSDYCFLDNNETLFYDRYTKTLHEWCPVRQESTQISHRKALRKYRRDLSWEGRTFFRVGPPKDYSEFHRAMKVVGGSVILAVFFLGIVWVCVTYPPLFLGIVTGLLLIPFLSPLF